MFRYSSHSERITPTLRTLLLTMATLGALVLILTTPRWSNAETLPKLGDPVSTIISPEKEQALGQALLRMLQSSSSIIQDLLLNEYLEHLVYRLASVSELQDPQLNVLLINSADINAFAMPGGILGINAGLFIHSQNEDELAAVVAHELAHLRQRHFARSVEKQDQTKWTTLTALLASLALVASGEGDAGLAALATTQAMSLDAQLSFSRQNEREADRIGMQTLTAAGFDSHAMPRFFERLSRSRQFSDDTPYEFLRTHPVTQARIADSRARAEQLSNTLLPQHTNRTSPARQSSLEFRLMRMKVLAAYAPTSQQAIRDFQAQINQSSNAQSDPALRFGLSQAYMRDNQLKAAEQTLAELLTQDPASISYSVTYAENLIKQKKYPAAIRLLEQQNSLNLNNYSIDMTLAKAYIKHQQGEAAVELLQKIIERKPNKPKSWKMLGEAYALTENKVGIHMAEAEVQFLSGQNDRAIEQLKFALDLVPKTNLPMTKKIESRLREFNQAKRRGIKYKLLPLSQCRTSAN